MPSQGLRVSVVIPTHNRASLVQRAIRCVLDQTQPPFEVIVVDDGSTDDTLSVLGAMPAPVRVVAKQNGGASSARNAGIAEARGDCVLFLDSDDVLEPEWLARATRVLAGDSAIGAVCAMAEVRSPEGEVLTRHDFRPLAEDGEILLPRLFDKRLALGSNLCVRMDVLRAVGAFAEDLATGEDVDMALRLAARTRIALVPEYMVIVTDSPKSLSKAVNTGNRLRVLDRFEAAFPEKARLHAAALRAARASTALSYAKDLTWSRQLTAAREKAAMAWSYGPSLSIAILYAKIAVLRLAGRNRDA